MKKHIALLLSVLMLFALLAGCSGDNEPVSGNEPAGGNEADDGEEASSGAKKDSLIAVVDNDPGTFTPYMSSKATESVFLDGAIYEPLFYLGENDEFVPALAESYELSADGLTHTFKLRQGVTFHNGEEFTAEDVLFTWLDLCFDSPYRAANFEGVTKEGITAPDEYTIQIALEKPNAALMTNLLKLTIMPKDYYNEVGEEGFNSAPIGTGAYKFVSYTPGDRIEMTAYDGYWGETGGIKDFTVRIIGDANTIAIALENGEVDLYDNMSPALYATLQENEDLQVEAREETRLNYIYFNTEKAPWDNVKLREAVCYAIDREFLIGAARSGLGNPLAQMALTNVSDSPKGVPQYSYDVEKAKALIAESGLGTPIDGGSILTVPTYKNDATVIQQMLAEIGVNIEVLLPEGNTFVSDSADGNFFIGTVGLTMTGHISGHNLLLNSSGIGAYNFARYSNPEVDALFVEAMQEPDAAKRGELYTELFTQVQADAPYCPLYIGTKVIVRAAGLDAPYLGNHSFMLIKNASWQ